MELNSDSKLNSLLVGCYSPKDLLVQDSSLYQYMGISNSVLAHGMMEFVSQAVINFVLLIATVNTMKTILP